MPTNNNKLARLAAGRRERAKNTAVDVVTIEDRLARLEGKDEGVGQRQQEKKSERVPHGGGRPGTRREPPVTRFLAARGRSLR